MGCGATKPDLEPQIKESTTTEQALYRALYGGVLAQKWKKTVADRNASARSYETSGTYYRDKNSRKYGSTKATVPSRKENGNKQKRKEEKKKK